jgi:hypothetical protein
MVYACRPLIATSPRSKSYPELMGRLILDLCGGTGAWSKPYRQAGYTVVLVDIHATVMDPRCVVVEQDVRLYSPPPNVWGVLMAPPCTMFARSGARWWKEKGEAPLEEALSVVRACLRIARDADPRWWCLENPAGRLRDYIGPPRMGFQPWEYGYPTRKLTYLWGRFSPPEKRPVKPKREEVHVMGATALRSLRRSVTPAPFARAFYKANP